MICPVVAYAPNAAMMPSIAAQPLNLSASGVIFLRGIKVWILIRCRRHQEKDATRGNIRNYSCNETEHGKATVQQFRFFVMSNGYIHHLHTRFFCEHVNLSTFVCRYCHCSVSIVKNCYYYIYFRYICQHPV